MVKRRDNTGFYVDVEFIFDDGNTNFIEDVSIDVPFETFMSTFINFCDSNYDVVIDGKDSSVWNLFSGTGFFESLFDDEDFVNTLVENYKNSLYYEEDYEEWVEDKKAEMEG